MSRRSFSRFQRVGRESSQTLIRLKFPGILRLDGVSTPWELFIRQIPELF